MEEFKHKPESGSLFRNKKKESDKHPDYKGSALVDGTEYWVSGWINESQSGKKYMSLKFQKKEESVKAEVITKSESGDDLPFS